ncbi:hypothetical protein [Mangrovimonas sp. ST2L15]|uniref:hypothetical protein n=1 Tax=Mangrovimonas sp. ST2L15 TaxID=1645916 RepID=UPI0006B5BDB8|nr:hypothetical protein [Mangrovimonas sp. ST2L15]
MSFKLLKNLPIVLIVLYLIVTKQLDLFNEQVDFYILIAINVISLIAMFFVFRDKTVNILKIKKMGLVIAFVLSFLIYGYYSL